MRYLYGFYTLDIEDTLFSIILHNLMWRLVNNAGYTGHGYTDYEDYKLSQKIGYDILTNNGKPIGVGYKTEESDRVWMVQDGDVYKLFIDAKPDIVRFLDMAYLPTSRSVILTLNGHTVIEEFK